MQNAAARWASHCCKAAPPVLEFDQQGKLVQGWGQGSMTDFADWPREPHGIFVDHQDNVWVGSYNRHRVMKFTRDGKLLLTLGQYEKTNGSADTTLLGGPSGIWVDPKTNEAFISDGYRNRRIIVFDGATGKYLRHWGAYGNVPDDTEKFDPKTMMSGALPKQFSTPHGITGSSDGKIYVADRRGNRIQVFDQSGKFIAEKVIAPATLSSGSAFVPVLSPDPQQQWLYVADGTNHKVWILRRSRSRDRRRVRPRRPAARPVPAPARHERRLAGQPLRRRSVDGTTGAEVHVGPQVTRRPEAIPVTVVPCVGRAHRARPTHRNPSANSPHGRATIPRLIPPYLFATSEVDMVPWTICRFGALAALVLLLLPAPAWSQTPTFNVEGVVTDAQQAVLPGVDRDHHQHRHRPDPHGRPPTTSGRYVVAALPPEGRYACRSRSPASPRRCAKNLVFNAGQRAVINFAMQLSTVQETITVAGDAPIVQTTSSEVSSTIDRQAFETLPVKERNYFRLLTLDSNVVATGTGLQRRQRRRRRSVELRHLRRRHQQPLEVADAAARAAARVERLRDRDGQGSAAHHQPVLGRVRRPLRRRVEHDHQDRHQRSSTARRS